MNIHPRGLGQSNQDSFVLNMLNNKTNGVYIEIGSNDPIAWNNTFLLETEFGWTGHGFEIIPELVDHYNLVRKNKCVCADATEFNYLKFFKEKNLPKQIDYLQLDIEPAENTLKALYKIPLEKYRFSVITYEHDLYASPENAMIKAEATGILKYFGYKLYAENVDDGIPSRQYEDWWIDPKVVKI